jgi:hypothetical protein
MSNITREEVVARDDAIVQVLNARFSALEAKMDRLHANVVKWVIGIGLAFSIGSLTFMTFVVHNAYQKSSQHPCVSHCACKHGA